MTKQEKMETIKHVRKVLGMEQVDFRDKNIDFINIHYNQALAMKDTAAYKNRTLAGSRNYNLNRNLDEHTARFEMELANLCEHYDCNIITETFDEAGKVLE